MKGTKGVLVAFSCASPVTAFCSSCHPRQTCFHAISCDRSLADKCMNPETNKARVRERNVKPSGSPIAPCDEDGFLGLLQNSCRAGGIVHMPEKKGKMEGGQNERYQPTFNERSVSSFCQNSSNLQRVQTQCLARGKMERRAKKK